MLLIFHTIENTRIRNTFYEQILITIEFLHRPTYQKIVRGEGMPFYRQNGDGRGDIILRFEIQLPLYADSVKSKEICGISSETNVHKIEKKSQSMTGKQRTI